MAQCDRGPNPQAASGFAAVASSQEPSRIFLATTTPGTYSRANVLTSTEGGNRWRPFTGDLRVDFSTAFGSSAVVADDRYLYFYARRRPWSEAELTSVNPAHAYHPTAFSLSQNYPNPFNPQTAIRYQVSGVTDVKLVVYDLLGREVATLVNEKKTVGSHEVSFDGAGLASGVYFYRLTAGTFVQSRKMLMLK